MRERERERERERDLIQNKFILVNCGKVVMCRERLILMNFDRLRADIEGLVFSSSMPKDKLASRPVLSIK